MHSIARYRVGEFDLAILSDGYMKLDAGAAMGIVPRVMWEPVLGRAQIDSEHRMRLALNCLLVRRGDDVVLVDTGMGDKHDARVRERVFPGEYGFLLGALSSLGISPSDITVVVNTHLHADHCGWNTVRRDGSLVPTFPRARYFIQVGELRDAYNTNERTRGTYFAENFDPVVQAGQVEPVDGERELVPGIVFLPAPGHTPSHAAVVVRSASQTAIYCGDLAHHGVQLERLAWIPAFDVLPLVSLETKRQLLERAVQERALLISPHLDFPGVGRLLEEEGRRRFVTA